jgi:hypothetical protein
MRFLYGFFRFWYDFIVGDDWRLAAGVVAVLVPGAVLVASTDLSDTVVSLTMMAGIFAVVGLSVMTESAPARTRTALD